MKRKTKRRASKKLLKTTPTPKKKTQRSRHRHASLMPRFISKIKQEYLDYDYINKLSESDKDFLAAFTSEYLNADFKHPLKRVIKKTKKNTKASYDGNNARNRCMYSNNRAKGNLNMVPQEKVNNYFGEIKDYSTNETEDALLEYLDWKIQEEKKDKPT